MLVPVSCEKERKAPRPEGTDAITFRSFDSGWTRAPSQLEESWDNFYVQACKWLAGATDPQTVIPGYRVRHDGVGWIYEDETAGQFKKYWDLSAGRYLFSAVAPSPDNSPGTGEGYRDARVSFGAGGRIDITGVIGNLSTGDYTNSSNSPDWMVAQTERRLTPTVVDTDMLDPSVTLHTAQNPLFSATDDVPLSFHHIMARTDVLVWATTPIILQTFKIESSDGQPILMRGNWSTAGGWTDKEAPEELKPLIFGDYTYTDGKTVSSNHETPTLLMSHVQIPQSWLATGRELLVTFTTKDNKTYSGTITLDDITNHTNSWLENIHYRYIIKIDTGSGTVQVILFAVDMDSWKWKEGSSFEDVQTEW